MYLRATWGPRATWLRPQPVVHCTIFCSSCRVASLRSSKLQEVQLLQRNCASVTGSTPGRHFRWPLTQFQCCYKTVEIVNLRHMMSSDVTPQLKTKSFCAVPQSTCFMLFKFCIVSASPKRTTAAINCALSTIIYHIFVIYFTYTTTVLLTSQRQGLHSEAWG